MLEEEQREVPELAATLSKQMPSNGSRDRPNCVSSTSNNQKKELRVRSARSHKLQGQSKSFARARVCVSVCVCVNVCVFINQSTTHISHPAFARPLGRPRLPLGEWAQGEHQHQFGKCCPWVGKQEIGEQRQIK